ncbi:MAG: hypothetical protein MUP98_19680 [Candidatus Aminicenantes bacterium]|nr:hypothetical protein [Candidatus Aminicenantes bacterium]
MKKRICPLETEIMEGLREKKLRPDLKKHVSECPVCKNIISVHAWMNQFKEESWKTGMEKKNFPDAESVWKKVYSRKRPDEKLVRKALRPLIFPKVMSFGVFLAGILFLGIKDVLKFENIFKTQVFNRIFPFFLILLSLVFLSAVFCTLLLALEKRKKPILLNSGTNNI